MKRFFFHVVGGGSEFRDENGGHFETLEDAVAHGTKIAAELAQDGDHYRGFVISVADDQDNELARVAVPS